MIRRKFFFFFLITFDNCLLPIAPILMVNWIWTLFWWSWDLTGLSWWECYASSGISLTCTGLQPGCLFRGVFTSQVWMTSLRVWREEHLSPWECHPITTGMDLLFALHGLLWSGARGVDKQYAGKTIKKLHNRLAHHYSESCLQFSKRGCSALHIALITRCTAVYNTACVHNILYNISICSVKGIVV